MERMQKFRDLRRSHEDTDEEEVKRLREDASKT